VSDYRVGRLHVWTNKLVHIRSNIATAINILSIGPNTVTVVLWRVTRIIYNAVLCSDKAQILAVFTSYNGGGQAGGTSPPPLREALASLRTHVRDTDLSWLAASFFRYTF